MSYENHQFPEGINVTQEHPLREFVWLSAAAAIGVVVALAAAITKS